MSVQVTTPLSVWVQLASLCFTLGGLFGDLLIIRFWLFMAYILLLINACLGGPLWGSAHNPGSISVDAMVWAIMGIYVHGSSLYRLILDERQVSLSDDMEALWRMFYRTAGMSRRLFAGIILSHVEVVETQPEQVLETTNYFYIQYTGRVHLRVLDSSGKPVVDTYTRSGEMYDFKYLGMFPPNSVFEGNVLECVCVDSCKLFRFSRSSMQQVANHQFVKSVWQSLLINNLSFVLERNHAPDSQLAEGECDAIFQPLQAWEHPTAVLAGSNQAWKRPWSHFVHYTKSSYSPPWGGHPTGMRQIQLPPPAPKHSTGDPQIYPPLHHMEEDKRSFSSRFFGRRSETT